MHTMNTPLISTVSRGNKGPTLVGTRERTLNRERTRERTNELVNEPSGYIKGRRLDELSNYNFFKKDSPHGV